VAALAQAADEVRRLVGGDPAADSEEDPAAAFRAGRRGDGGGRCRCPPAGLTRSVPPSGDFDRLRKRRRTVVPIDEVLDHLAHRDARRLAVRHLDPRLRAPDELLGALGGDQDVAEGAVDAIGNLFHESSSASHSGEVARSLRGVVRS
jgi:hypothetical protein